MNEVDLIVKDSILNYFSIHPTRMHVLRHCLLSFGTGYEFVERDDGLLYLEKVFTRGETNNERVEHEEHEVSEFHFYSTGMENLVRDWVSDNIDDYCKKSFYWRFAVNLQPAYHTRLVCEMFSPVMLAYRSPEKIAPVWREAIQEVCAYFMTQISITFGCATYMDCLDSLTGTAREDYRMLQNAWKAIENMPENKRKRMSLANIAKRITDEVFAEEREEKVEKTHSRYAPSLTREEFLAYCDELQAMEHYSIGECGYFIKEHLVCTEKYFPDGKPNESFFSDYEKARDRCHWPYFTEGDIASQIHQMLKISWRYKPFVRKLIASDLSACFGS